MSDYTPKDVRAVITRVKGEGDVEVMRLDQRVREGYARLADVASWPLDKYKRSDYLRQVVQTIADMELQIWVTPRSADKRGEE